MAPEFFIKILHPDTLQKLMQSFFKKSKLHVLDWPGKSPDLNPIENLWAIVKKRLEKCDCSTITKLIEAIIRIWHHDEELKNICSNLVDSMPTRISQSQRRTYQLLKLLGCLNFSFFASINVFSQFCDFSDFVPIYLHSTVLQ